MSSNLLLNISIIIFISFLFDVSAQKTLTANDTSIRYDFLTNDIMVLDLETTIENNWKFYQDEDKKCFYIDFEVLGINVIDIHVQNRLGEIVLKENLLNIPNNSMYVLDFQSFKQGNYIIILRTHNETINESFTVK